MDSLWAPWRMEFIRGAHDPDADCVFCTLPHQTDRLRENLLLARGRHVFVILNKFPYNNGHLMVIPYRHTAELPSLDEAEHAEMSRYTTLALGAMRDALGPDGFNLGMNLGRAGGAGIAEHLHQHVVPRWNGDTNFLPIIGETKSLPEHILATWDRLRPHFEGSDAAEGPADGSRPE